MGHDKWCGGKIFRNSSPLRCRGNGAGQRKGCPDGKGKPRGVAGRRGYVSGGRPSRPGRRSPRRGTATPWRTTFPGQPGCPGRPRTRRIRSGRPPRTTPSLRARSQTPPSGSRCDPLRRPGGRRRRPLAARAGLCQERGVQAVVRVALRRRAGLLGGRGARLRRPTVRLEVAEQVVDGRPLDGRTPVDAGDRRPVPCRVLAGQGIPGSWNWPAPRLGEGESAGRCPRNAGVESLATGRCAGRSADHRTLPRNCRTRTDDCPGPVGKDFRSGRPGAVRRGGGT